MSLKAGAELGPYEIAERIGAGGMGEVYKARDVRLDRDVAIKIVADGGSAPADRLEHEARAVAALNHPHICTLHDLGREGDTSFLVMELVEGQTLAARLLEGPLPVRDVIRHAIQIAEALDHAHRHGVLHRDLKPANIVLTPAGVKVLDFGLATLRAAAPVHVPLDRTPNARADIVSDRALLGTIHYMAPERLEGMEATEASDLFAFGVVMYEMATGSRPFESTSAAGVIAAILRSEPPAPSTIRPGLPASIDWVIRKSLATGPDARWHSAADLVEVLRWIARLQESGAALPRTTRRLGPAAAAAVLVAVSLVGFAGRERAPDVADAPLMFSISPPPGGGFTPTPSSVASPQFALSSNGRRIVYAAALEGHASQLWMRPLDSLDAAPVPGTDGAEYPFWSPDGQSIGFFAGGSLKRIDLAGGPARVLASAPHGRGGAWNTNGTILFAPTTQGGLFSVPASGGDPTRVTDVDHARQEASHRWPQFLPDNRHFIFFVQGAASATHGIHLGDLRERSSRRLIDATLSASFVGPDHLLFVSDDALVARAFDWGGMQLVGDPFVVVPSIVGSSNFYAAFSASASGMLIYATGAARAELAWIDRTGRKLAAVGPPAQYVDFRLSPHDHQLAIAEVDPDSHRPDIRVLDLHRGGTLRLTHDSATDAAPVWSPEGDRIAFRSNRSGQHNLYSKSTNGTGAHETMLASRDAKYPTDWLPDGRLVYHTADRESGCDIWMLSAERTSSVPLVQTRYDEMQGQVSSDGRWLAYTSTETGQPQVYIRRLVEPIAQWPVSSGGGRDPRWRGDGRELYFVSGDSWMTAVEIAEDAPGPPRKLFHAPVPPLRTPYVSNYDVTADGERFLVKLPIDDVTSTPIHVLTSWFARRP